MFAKTLIEKDLPAIDIDENVGLAISYMEEENLEQLVLVHDNEVLGVVEKEILLNFPETSKMSLVPIKHEAAKVDENMHFLQVAEYCINSNLDVCAVVDVKGKYLGSIKAMDVFKKVIAGQFSGNGGLISLQIDQKDYSLSDISRIIETEGLRIEKLFLAKENQNEYQFILKLNKKEITPAVNSLKRFGYKAVSLSKSESGAFPDKERFEHLMKYLEI